MKGEGRGAAVDRRARRGRGHAGAMCALGASVYNGTGAARDVAVGRTWLTSAAAGDAQAAAALAHFDGVP